MMVCTTTLLPQVPRPCVGCALYHVPSVTAIRSHCLQSTRTRLFANKDGTSSVSSSLKKKEKKKKNECSTRGRKVSQQFIASIRGPTLLKKRLVTTSASKSVEQDVESTSSAVTSDDLVLVLGATGGVGQLVVASLLDRGYKVRALLRDSAKASTIFKGKDERLQVHIGDLRQRESLTEDVFQGVTRIVCTTGTTAFPSKRWEGNNNPEQADWVAVRNVLEAVPPGIQRFVLVSSIGVTKSNQLPFNILNLFGVLKYKKMGEDHLRSSGIPFTILRAGRLTDGPYTSYDLNTLLKATAGKRQQITIAQGDNYKGETSRLAVAEACVQALSLDCTQGQVYEIGSVEGDGPGKDSGAWEVLFKRAHLAP